MSESFIGEIRMFAGTFAPRNHAFCDGQLLQISQNDALFSLLGTTYGGDGRSIFALPDLRGRIPIHAGTGPGLPARALGSKAGSERITLTQNQLPSHGHAMQASGDVATTPNPANSVLSETVTSTPYIQDTPLVSLNSLSISNLGGGQRHDNFMPFLCINFIIALFGVYPSRN